ncbi:hypothetical protein [Emticicia agri]|uniref:Uncharacterized protein n=1 Tax=Emticicia agri TaxID=2492393 RepID=A0A4Q5LTF6_9BACT|nr:hypothetical protein [Emticicia agri]RYU92854.1 hypothetical protein EWM59_24960 [Emticicia agri]
MKYLQWNHIIGEFFFNSSNAGKEVLLYITRKEIADLGMSNFGFKTEAESWGDFCQAIKGGFPETYSANNFIQKFLKVSDKWLKYKRVVFELNNNSDLFIDKVSIYSPNIKIVYPFYLGYLITLIIPLTDNVDIFRPNSFFPPVRNFLKENKITNSDNLTTIEEIDWVWKDLEIWSKEYYKTDLGYFEEARFGNQNWIYVNKIFSQCLLTPKNIRDIPKIFWEAGIAPNSIISEKQFQRIIINYGVEQAKFSKRVCVIINEENNSLGKIIVDIVKREYNNWKGDVIEYGDNEKGTTYKSGWVYATLLSAFRLNKGDETFKHFYYVYSQNDFPEDLSFGEYRIENMGNGYSKPINIKFSKNLNLVDQLNKWRVSNTQNDILLYSSGLYFGLSADDFIETDKISLLTTMYILCPHYKQQSIEDWGKSFIKGDFNLIDYDGIPTNFLLYRFKNPKQSHPTEELLRLPIKKRVEILGGIKNGNRRYLNNFLPRVYIGGSNGNEKVFLEFKESRSIIYLKKSESIPEEFIIPENVIYNEDFFIKTENEDLDNSELPYQINNSEFDPLDIVAENLDKKNKLGEICNEQEKDFVIGINTIYNDWQMQANSKNDFFSNDYISSDFNINYSNYIEEKGNLILKILSLKKNCTFQEFSDIIDTIEYNTKIWTLSEFQQNPKYIKQTLINFYDSLGFLNYHYSRNNIIINKPQFVIIPSISSLKAILIGGRSKFLIDNLQNICNEYRINLEVIPQPRKVEIYYLPDLIRLTPANCKNSTEAWMKLQKIANILNIDFRLNEKPYLQPQIIQFGLQDFSENINSYKQYILNNKLIEKPDYEWARKTFDTNHLKFLKINDLIDKNLSLQEYYIQYKYIYIFWLNNLSYEVDRNWGRFLLLSEKGKRVIYYYLDTQELAIPKDIQLPQLIAKSIILLSGQAPIYKKMLIEGNYFTYQFYQNVPKLFAENLFNKFKQKIQFKKIDKDERPNYSF